MHIAKRSAELPSRGALARNSTDPGKGVSGYSPVPKMVTFVCLSIKYCRIAQGEDGESTYTTAVAKADGPLEMSCNPHI